MRSWSIPVGRLFRNEIRVHLTFVFLLIFLLSTDGATADPSVAVRIFALVGIVFRQRGLSRTGPRFGSPRLGHSSEGHRPATDRRSHDF